MVNIKNKYSSVFWVAAKPGYPLYLFKEAESKKKNKMQDRFKMVFFPASCFLTFSFFKKDAAAIPAAIAFSKYNHYCVVTNERTI